MTDRRAVNDAVLERNIERLLNRAWQRPAVRDSFRTELEARLVANAAARWSPPEPVRRTPPWRAAALAAAAAVLLWLGSGPELFEPSSEQPAVDPDGLALADGGGAAAFPDAAGDTADADGATAAPTPANRSLLSGLFGPVGSRRLPAIPGLDLGSDAPASDDDTDASPPATLHLAVTVPDPANGPGPTLPREAQAVLLRAAQLPDVAEPQLYAIAFEGGGRARLDDLPGGRHTVYLYVDGFAPWRRDVDLPAGGTLELAAALELGSAAVGRVVDAATGEPIVGALVASETDVPLQVLSPTLESDTPVPMITAATDADGSYRLSPLGKGAHRLRVTAAGHAPAWTDVTVGVDGRADLQVEEFRLAPGGAVRGRVLDDAGAPREGAVVIVSYFDSPGGTQKGFYGADIVDAAGDFDVPGLPAGMHVVLLFETDDPVAPTAMIPLVLDVGEVQRINFEPERAGARIFGVVRGADGAPLADHALTLAFDDADRDASAEANAPGWTATTSDGAGRFEFRAVGAGSAAIFGHDRAGAEMVRYAVLDVAENVDRELIIDRPAGVVVGRVAGLDGIPASDATVFLVTDPPDGRRVFMGRSIADVAGRYEFEGVAAGDYAVVVLPNRGDHAITMRDELRLGPGEPRLEVDVPLGPAGSLRVTVTDPEGRPIDRADLDIFEPDGVEIADDGRFKTRRDGVAKIDCLSPGPWRVVVEAPGYTEAERTVTAVAGETRPLSVTLIPASDGDSR